MGIHLDWEVESDFGNDTVSENAEVVAKRRLQKTRMKRGLIGAALLVFILGAVGVMRWREVEKQRKLQLASVVETEALALRLGNKHQFMLLQGPVEEWRAKQRNRFEEFMRYEEQIVVEGSVLSMDISGDEARVAVQLIVNSQPDSAVWLYEFTENGWRHVATESEPWTPLDREINGIQFSYYPVDKQQAEQLAALMADWWPKAQAMTGVDEPLHVQITLEPDATRMIWDDEDQTRLIIPSRVDGAATGGLAFQTRIELAERLADRWAVYAMGERKISGVDRWAFIETEKSLLHVFDPASPPSMLFESLAAAFGPGIMPDFLTAMRDDEMSADNAVTAAMQENARRNLNDDELNAYLTNYMLAELAFATHDYGSVIAYDDNSRVARIFYDPERSGLPNRLYPSLPTDQLTTLQVTGTHEAGGLIWAEVMVTYPVNWWPDEEPEMYEAIAYIPFREVDGLLMQTWAIYDDWGDEIVDEGLVTVHYYELDAPYMENFQTEIEAMYRKISGDMGVDEPHHFDIFVTPDSSIPASSGLDSQYVFSISSIHGNCCAGVNDPQEYLRGYVGISLLYTIYNTQAGDDWSSYYASPIIESTLIEWEVERMGLANVWNPYVPDPQPSADAALPQSLNDLWFATEDWSTERSYFESYANKVAVKALLNLVVERYGDVALAALVANLRTSISMDDWLTRSLNATVADLEADWRTRFAAELQAATRAQP